MYTAIKSSHSDDENRAAYSLSLWDTEIKMFNKVTLIISMGSVVPSLHDRLPQKNSKKQ